MKNMFLRNEQCPLVREFFSLKCSVLQASIVNLGRPLLNLRIPMLFLPPRMRELTLHPRSIANMALLAFNQFIIFEKNTS